MLHSISLAWRSPQALLRRHAKIFACLDRPSMTIAQPQCVSRHFSTAKGNGNTPEAFAELLNILVCPISKEPLRYDPEANELICDAISVAYPVKNGIPNFVPSDARIIKSE